MTRRPVAIAAALAVAGATLLASIALAAGSAGPPGQAQRTGACPNAGEPATDLTAEELRRAVRCRINLERAARDRGPLARDPGLQRAARRHAETMVLTDCLAHRCGEEVELEERIRREGYFVGADAWEFAESTGCAASAKAMVTNWMESHFHRVNILDRAYQDVGVGAVQEPVATRCEKGYATFAVVFAWRTPPAV